MRSLSYASGKQRIDSIDSETTRQCNPSVMSGGLATWLKRTLGTGQRRGFLLMTPEGKLSCEQRLLKER